LHHEREPPRGTRRKKKREKVRNPGKKESTRPSHGGKPNVKSRKKRGYL